jgi:1-acyl-sn-glycerol-3-phosphate acyltransferase
VSRSEHEDAADLAALVIETVRRLAMDLHPGGPETTVRLDSDLATEVGLDSLSMAELGVRLETACGTVLPDQALTQATTPADLVRVLAEARSRAVGGPAGGERPPWRPTVPESTPVERLPDSVGTLGEVLAWHLQVNPRRTHIRLLEHGGALPAVREITYAELARRAFGMAQALAARGIDHGSQVAIMLPTGLDYFAAFLGTILARGVPVPLYPPTRPSQLEDHLRRHARILDNARAVALITVPEARGLARLLQAHSPRLGSVLTPGELAGGTDTSPTWSKDPDDIALLQYTSGSTGDPKGVVLTHAQLLANIRALGAAAHADPSDVFVSWLPLYHDMGLIGAWLGSLYHAIPFVVMSPLDFLARPARWLWAVHTHQATVSAAPNFGYEFALRIGDNELAGLDLSSWRLAFNGAEPVSPETVRRFTERFEPYGFRAEAMAPVYGLAEAAVGLTFPPLGRRPPVDVIARKSLARDGRAQPASSTEPAALRFVGCGRPLPGYQIRVVDAAGHELGERREGRIEFTGPSATSGYYRAPEQTAKLRRGQWLDTGDLGYLADGDLYLTGRAKDLIIRAGSNLHPGELEDAVGQIPGIRRGCVAAFPATDPRSGTERLVVVAETRARESAVLAELRTRVITITVDVLGTPPDDVVLAPPGTVLKTSSGKIRRAASRARYEAGTMARTAGPAWWQVVRFAAAGALPELRRWTRAGSAALFAGYAWAVLLTLAPPVWLAVVTLPRLSWRWRVLRAAGRILRWATRIPLSVVGAERISGIGPCVIVANHASYVDGLALILSLPRPVTFVAAADLRSRPISGTLLRRLGCVFVERRAPRPGAPDIRGITQAVRSGHTVAFFPEGFVSPSPGLRAFHLGAFTVAVEAGVPVVPVSISGTRTLLGPGHRFPRRTAVRVQVADPIAPTDGRWESVVALRDAARKAVLIGGVEYDAAT